MYVQKVEIHMKEETEGRFQKFLHSLSVLCWSMSVAAIYWVVYSLFR